MHSGLARINLATKQVNEYDDVRVGTCLWNDAANDKIYVIGTQDEWVWTPGAKKTYSIFVANTVSGDMSEHSLPDGITYPYSIAVDSVSGDIFTGDAADGKTPGSTSGRCRRKRTEPVPCRRRRRAANGQTSSSKTPLLDESISILTIPDGFV